MGRQFATLIPTEVGNFKPPQMGEIKPLLTNLRPRIGLNIPYPSLQVLDQLLKKHYFPPFLAKGNPRPDMLTDII